MVHIADTHVSARFIAHISEIEVGAGFMSHVPIFEYKHMLTLEAHAPKSMTIWHSYGTQFYCFVLALGNRVHAENILFQVHCINDTPVDSFVDLVINFWNSW